MHFGSSGLESVSALHFRSRGGPTGPLQSDVKIYLLFMKWNLSTESLLSGGLCEYMFYENKDLFSNYHISGSKIELVPCT